MKKRKEQPNWSEKLGSILGITVFTISVIGGIYGFVQWIDDRYVQNIQLSTLAANTAMAIYNQRIVSLRSQEDYILEFEPTNKKELKSIRDRIIEIKKHRRSFLQDGNYTTGDSILINIKRFRQTLSN